MKVLRVENENGNGPYFYASVPGIHDAHGSSRSHPGPGNDPGIGDDFQYGMLFGFESREQLDKWFKGWKRILHQEGFVIRTYEVPKQDVIIGKRQIVFRRNKAEVVDTSPVVR